MQKKIFYIFIQIFIFTFFSCYPSKSVKFLEEIGVCTSISNAEILAQHGYTYIEESVGSFLMPTKSEEEFNLILQELKEVKLSNRVNHPNFCLLADIYHMLMDNEGFESIIKYGHLIKHVYIVEKEKRSALDTYKEYLQINLIDDALKYTRLSTKLLKEADMQNSYADLAFVKARHEFHSFMSSNLKSLSVNMGRTYFHYNKALNTLRKSKK